MSRQLSFAAALSLVLTAWFVLGAATGGVAGDIPQAALALAPFAGR